jgi:hypothetical protein
MIKQMEAKDMVDGLVISGSKEDPPFGESCAYGQSHRMVFSWKEHCKKAKKMSDLVHYDLCGLINTPIIGAHCYFLFKDDHYGFKVIYIIKEKLIVPECL